MGKTAENWDVTKHQRFLFPDGRRKRAGLSQTHLSDPVASLIFCSTADTFDIVTPRAGFTNGIISITGFGRNPASFAPSVRDLQRPSQGHQQRLNRVAP